MKTRKRPTRSNFAGLPQELITQILLLLPAKSIGKFRCVSKPSNSLLSNPYLIRSHLFLHSIHNPPNLILISSSQSLFTLNFTQNISKTISCTSRKDGVSRKLEKSAKVMKEYGVLESWTKFIVSMPGNVDCFSPICQLGDEEVAFLEDDTKLVLYNLKEEASRDMVVPGMMNMYYCGIMTFSGSLVSPSFCRWDEET